MSMDVNGYTTHQPLTVVAALHATGLVVECGSGHYSTALLYSLCKAQGVKLLSFDEDPEWARAMTAAYNGLHTVEYCPDIAARLRAMPEAPDMLFVDNGAFKIAPLWERRRCLEVARDRNIRLTVCHDTEPCNRWKYQYDKAFPWFKHQVHFVGSCFRLSDKYPPRPWACALSNSDDLQWLRDALPERPEDAIAGQEAFDNA